MKLLYFIFLSFGMISTVIGCCIFDGKVYEDGQHLPGACFVLHCCGNEWKTDYSISKECTKCQLCNDPHIWTFDNMRYDWHGTCNYSISQPFGPKTFDPEFGIFGDFKSCGNKFKASCLDVTTYKADEHTILEFTHGSQRSFKVNGVPYTDITGHPAIVKINRALYPLLVWDDSNYCQFSGKCSKVRRNCLHIQGPTFSLLMCKNCLYVWTHSGYKNTLGGLCGLYSENVTDDFTHRNKYSDPLTKFPRSFPMSWMAVDQKEYGCSVCYDPSYKASSGYYHYPGTFFTTSTSETTTSATSSTSESTTDASNPYEYCEENFYDLCYSELREEKENIRKEEFESILDICIYDTCANPDEAKLWVENAKEIALKEIEIQERTFDHFTNDYIPSH